MGVSGLGSTVQAVSQKGGHENPKEYKGSIRGLLGTIYIRTGLCSEIPQLLAMLNLAFP